MRDMLELHDPEKGMIGDCWRACIASILDLPCEEVPHFVREEIEGKGHWMELTVRWLNGRGFGIVQCSRDGLPKWISYGTLMIACGPGPRHGNHCVIMDQSGSMVHDPHPSREGILRDGDFYMIVKGWSY